MKFKVAPLSGTFMLISIFGFLFATMFLAKLQGAESWAFAIGFLSVLMFIASVISMTRAPIEEELAIDEHHTEVRARKKVISNKKKSKKKSSKRK